jgi:hypothetical protein
MAQPEEFKIRIEPDGRIVLDAPGMHETSYRRIIEFLEATVGPAHQVEAAPLDPPSRHLHSAARADETEAESARQELGQRE